ncbi:hypothetical protein PLUA15_40065 [Pseudomonas lundensis]|uniref:Uncharacterized protein n=1 Tax=Pseudomonas lundensis TaxID=86185 RepID=A0AAX2HAC9_9PSED|nr:hypothetical protein PLUA15_40065 [Pseudomonas lundensis]
MSPCRVGVITDTPAHTEFKEPSRGITHRPVPVSFGTGRFFACGKVPTEPFDSAQSRLTIGLD